MAQLNPSPNLDLAPTSQSLSLQMEKSVLDSVVVSFSSTAQMEVNDWRSSLEKGFINAFQSSYALGKEGPSELTLQLVEVNPDLVFGSVSNDSGKATGQIRYKARLLDAQGNIIKRLTGTALGHKDALSRETISLALQSAVETMYEEIAANFFGASVAGVTPTATN